MWERLAAAGKHPHFDGLVKQGTAEEKSNTNTDLVLQQHLFVMDMFCLLKSPCKLLLKTTQRGIAVWTARISDIIRQMQCEKHKVVP